jgi:hypothetical protein
MRGDGADDGGRHDQEKSMSRSSVTMTEDESEFWSEVNSIANVIDGEGTTVAQRQLNGLLEYMDEWLSKHPEVPSASDYGYAMRAVYYLVLAVAGAFWREAQWQREQTGTEAVKPDLGPVSKPLAALEKKRT